MLLKMETLCIFCLMFSQEHYAFRIKIKTKKHDKNLSRFFKYNLGYAIARTLDVAIY